MAKNKHIGSSLEDHLRAEGALEEVVAKAQKEVLAWQLREAMRKEKVSESELARRMKTSRMQVRRLLDPENASATIISLSKAAIALGRDLRVELVSRKRRRKAL